MTLGEYIKAYREAHGESQRSFAALCFWTILLYIFVKIKDRPSLDGHNAKLGSHHPESDRLPISLFDEI